VTTVTLSAMLFMKSATVSSVIPLFDAPLAARMADINPRTERPRNLVLCGPHDRTDNKHVLRQLHVVCHE
jgi:hypothetical protein